jgi:hypothetical protein
MWGNNRKIFMRKELQGSNSKDFQDNGEYFEASCNNKSDEEWSWKWQVYADIHRDISVVVNCKDDAHKGIGKITEGYLPNLRTKQVIFQYEGSPGEVVTRT